MMNAQSPEAGKSIRFELSGTPGSRMFFAGSFHNWNPTASPMRDNPDSGQLRRPCVFPQGRTSTSSLSMASELRT